MALRLLGLVDERAKSSGASSVRRLCSATPALSERYLTKPDAIGWLCDEDPSGGRNLSRLDRRLVLVFGAALAAAVLLRAPRQIEERLEFASEPYTADGLSISIRADALPQDRFEGLNRITTFGVKYNLVLDVEYASAEVDSVKLEVPSLTPVSQHPESLSVLHAEQFDSIGQSHLALTEAALPHHDLDISGTVILYSDEGPRIWSYILHLTAEEPRVRSRSRVMAYINSV